MYKLMTHESPAKILSLLAASVLSMFFMAGVATTNVTWSDNSGTAIADPFSLENVMAFIDQGAWVYSGAVHNYLLDPAVADYSFIPDNLMWIKDSAELAIAVSVGLADPLPQVSAGPVNVPEGKVAGAMDYSPQYYDNVFTLLYYNY